MIIYTVFVFCDSRNIQNNNFKFVLDAFKTLKQPIDNRATKNQKINAHKKKPFVKPIYFLIRSKRKTKFLEFGKIELLMGDDGSIVITY